MSRSANILKWILIAGSVVIASACIYALILLWFFPAAKSGLLRALASSAFLIILMVSTALLTYGIWRSRRWIVWPGIIVLVQWYGFVASYFAVESAFYFGPRGFGDHLVLVGFVLVPAIVGLALMYVRRQFPT